MANKDTADNTTNSEASAPESTATAATQPHPANSDSQAPRKSRWVLPAIAGVGLVSLGLLGGILIGQQVGQSAVPDRGPDARILIEHQQSGQRERLPERLQERMRERLQDVRGRHKQAPSEQSPDQPTPSTPTPDDQG